MPRPMTKARIVAHLSEQLGVDKAAVSKLLDELATLAYKEARNTFTLPGLGKLVLVNRRARMGRNPATGEEIKIQAKRIVRFRVSKTAKDEIEGGYGDDIVRKAT